MGSEGPTLVWVCEIRGDLEGQEGKSFQAWTLTPCVYSEGGLVEKRVWGRRTSGRCEGREGVQERDGESDRQNRWKVTWKTLNYGLQRREDERLRLDSGEESDCRRPRERNARCREEVARHSLAWPWPRPLTTATPVDKSLTLPPFSHCCGTVAEWLWRHV